MTKPVGGGQGFLASLGSTVRGMMGLKRGGKEEARKAVQKAASIITTKSQDGTAPANRSRAVSRLSEVDSDSVSAEVAEVARVVEGVKVEMLPGYEIQEEYVGTGRKESLEELGHLVDSGKKDEVRNILDKAVVEPQILDVDVLDFDKGQGTVGNRTVNILQLAWKCNSVKMVTHILEKAEANPDTLNKVTASLKEAYKSTYGSNPELDIIIHRFLRGQGIEYVF